MNFPRAIIRFRTAAVSAVLLPIALACVAFSADAPSLSGRIVDHDTGNGIPRLAVRLVPENADAQTVIALTDAEGRYRIADLEAQRYRFELRQGSTVIHRETIVVAGEQVKNIALVGE